MATTTIGYRAKDIPVGHGAGATFITRAQTFEVTKTMPHTNAYELGNIVSAGAVAGASQYTGRLVAFSVGTAIETAFGDTDWKGILEADGIALKCSQFGISGAKCTGITYTGRVGGGWATETFEFEGSGETSGAVSATSPPTGVAGAQAPKMSVSVNNTTGVRLQGYNIRVTAAGSRLEELNNSSIVGIVYDQPRVEVTLEFITSGSTAGNIDTLTVASPGDIIVTLKDATDDSTMKTITVYDAVSTGQPSRGTVGGWVTETYSYLALGNETEEYGGIGVA